MIQQMLAIWSLVPLPFLNPSWTSGSSRFTYYWSLAWRILSIPLLVYEINTIVEYFEHSLALPFFGIGMKTDLFQSYGHCWGHSFSKFFQTCWHIECSAFTASSFRIWNSQRSNPCPLHWKYRILTLGPPGTSLNLLLTLLNCIAKNDYDDKFFFLSREK